MSGEAGQEGLENTPPPQETQEGKRGGLWHRLTAPIRRRLEEREKEAEDEFKKWYKYRDDPSWSKEGTYQFETWKPERTFSDESRSKLEEAGYRIYKVGNMLSRTEVAINPNQVDLPELSGNKIEASRANNFDRFSRNLGRDLSPGVRAIIGNSSDYEHLASEHRDATGEALFDPRELIMKDHAPSSERALVVPLLVPASEVQNSEGQEAPNAPHENETEDEYAHVDEGPISEQEAEEVRANYWRTTRISDELLADRLAQNNRRASLSHRAHMSREALREELQTDENDNTSDNQ